MKIDGIVVLYNPDDLVFHNILTYVKKLNHLFVCDNSTNYNNQLIIRISELGNTSIINMNGNKGIASALKEGMSQAINDKCDFCLTMDQDSKFPTERWDFVCSFLQIDNIDEFGIIGLNFNNNNQNNNLKIVNYWLTSGNFINIHNYILIDGFNEKLFIDYVDIELDEQFYKIGKKIAYIDSVSLEHSIGKPIKKIFFGKVITCMNHSPIRYYYRYRNNLYLYKRNKTFYKLKYMHDIFIDIPKVILFEKQKIRKIHMIMIGRRDALNGTLGQYKEK